MVQSWFAVFKIALPSLEASVLILTGFMKHAAYLTPEQGNEILFSTYLIFEQGHFAVVPSSQHFRLYKPLLQFLNFASTLQCRYLQHIAPV
jgi:hypothetical protein